MSDHQTSSFLQISSFLRFRFLIVIRIQILPDGGAHVAHRECRACLVPSASKLAGPATFRTENRPQPFLLQLRCVAGAYREPDLEVRWCFLVAGIDDNPTAFFGIFEDIEELL